MTFGLITSVLSLIGHARQHIASTTTTFAPAPPPPPPPPPFQPFQPFPPPFQPPPFEPPPFEPQSFEPPPFQPPPFEPSPPSQFEPPQPSFNRPPPRPRPPPPPPPPENRLIPLPDDLGPPTSPDFIPPSRFDSAPARPANPVFDELPRSSTPAFESLLPPPVKSRFNRESQLSTVSSDSQQTNGASSHDGLSTNLDGLIKGHIASQLRTKRYATSGRRTQPSYSKKRKNAYSAGSKNRVQHVALPLETPSPVKHEQGNAKTQAFMTPPPPWVPTGDDSGKFSLEPFPAHSNALVLPATPLALENPKHRRVRQTPPTAVDLTLDGVLVGPLEAPDRLACLNRARHATFKNHAYFFPWEEPELRNLRLNWLAARNFCRRRCMDLMSLETAGENMLIREKIMRSGKNRVWTSGRLCDFPGCDRTDLLPLRTNGWFWAASGTRIVGRSVGGGFQDWANSVSSRTTNAFQRDREACVVIGTTSASSLPRWMEMGCRNELEFVCEDNETLLRLVNVT